MDASGRRIEFQCAGNGALGAVSVSIGVYLTMKLWLKFGSVKYVSISKFISGKARGSFKYRVMNLCRGGVQHRVSIFCDQVNDNVS